MAQPAHTVTGRLEQARRWLAHPDRDDRGLGQRAIALIVEEGKKVRKDICIDIKTAQAWVLI